MSNQKGISLISLIVTIIVMLIISAMLVYNGINNTKIEKLTKLNSDIGVLKDSVNLYYLKNNTLPVKFENDLKKVLDLNQVLEEIGEERSQDDNDIYYILDTSVLENITLNTKDVEDAFIINDQSHNIYYIEGVKLDQMDYHATPEKIDAPVIRITPNIARASIGESITVTIQVLGPVDFRTDNVYQYYVSDSRTQVIGGTWLPYISGEPLTITASGAATKYIHVKSVTDILGQVAPSKVSDKFIFEDTAPTVSFTPNGNLTLKTTQSTKVIVTDPDNGLVDSSSLKYQWTQSTIAPLESTFFDLFVNGSIISKTVVTIPEEWYLWILAKDSAGNTSIQRSDKFIIGPVIPMVTITADKPSGQPTNAATIQYTFTWNVDVMNFNANGITVTNGTKGTFTTVNPKIYRLNITTGASQNSNLEVSVAGNVCTDTEGTNNIASSTYSMFIDRILPVESTTSITTFNATGTGNTGSYQEYNIPSTGTYKIKAWGASGANGPTSPTKGTAQGGKGAYVYGEFNFNQNEKLIMLVGQQGTMTGTPSSTSDLTSGGGGGGTFVTKVNSGSSYTLTAKAGEKVTPLLIAAGGNGGNDAVYTTKVDGANGLYTGSTLGTGFTTKFLTAPNGTTYTRNGLTAVGGYGGATGVDDSNGLAGGAVSISGNTANTSYNTGTNTTGITGENTGHGKIEIEGGVPGTRIYNVSKAGMTLNFSIGLLDNQDGSGINLSASKYILDTGSSLKGTTSIEWTGASSKALTGVDAAYAETLSGDGAYYIHLLAVDNAGNKIELISQPTYVDATAPTLTLTNLSGANSYPVVVQIETLDSASGIDYIETPEGTRIELDGETTYTTTYNATKNGVLAFKLMDRAGNETTQNINITNVLEFITEWTTSAPNTTVKIYKTVWDTSTQAVDVNINWGDGTVENIKQTLSTISHTYASPGSYDVKITGTLPYFSTYNYNVDPSNINTKLITEIKQWGCLETVNFRFDEAINMTGSILLPHEKSFEKVTSFIGMFQGCTGITGGIPEDLFKNALLADSFHSTFSGCSNLTGNIPTNLFRYNTAVDEFEYTFYECENLTGSIPADLFRYNTLAETFRYVFNTCTGLTGSIPAGLFSYNTMTTDFSGAFSACGGLTGNIPANLFQNNPLVVEFDQTFSSCEGLTGTIPTGLFQYNTEITTLEATFYSCDNLTGIGADLFKYNTKVTTFEATFAWCRNLTGSIPIDLFRYNTLVTMFDNTFEQCESLTGSIPTDLFRYCTVAEYFSSTFWGCSGLTGSIPTDLFRYNIGAIDFHYTFAGCSGLTGSIPAGLFANNPLVTDFGGVFAICYGLTGSIPADLFRYNPAATAFYGVFYECNNLSGSIPADLFRYNTLAGGFYETFYNCVNLTGSIPATLFQYNTVAESFNYTFYGCYGLTGSIPIGLFDNNPLVTEFGHTFYNCNSLTGSIPTDLFRYNTLVDSFTHTFMFCSSLTGSIPVDLFRYNTEVTYFLETFAYCGGLTGNIPTDFFKYNTKVTNMNGIFSRCSGLTGSIPVDLFRYNTLVTSLNLIFDGCSGLTGSIPTDLFRYNTIVTQFYCTFYGCSGLTGSIPTDLFRYNTLVTTISQTFYNCTGLTQLPTSLFDYNTVVTRFDYTFAGCTNLTGTAPDLWNRGNVTDYSQCFRNCTLLSNYASIPASWK